MYAKPVRGLLDPVDRVSEVLFGLIMVLTSTSTLSVVTAGRAEISTMIMAALGCNLAWGIIDAALYLLGSLDERGRNLLMLRAVRRTQNPEEARRLMADALAGNPSFATPSTADFSRCAVMSANCGRCYRDKIQSGRMSISNEG